MKRVFRYIFAFISLLVFIFLIKAFYFDTKIGFNTEILELNYSAFPMCVDVAITVLICPFIVYAFLDDIYDRIYSKFNPTNVAN